MERVSVIENGKTPVIFVSPHYDDTNTGLVAESAARAMNAYLVKNNGWKRGDQYDYCAETCDCNDVRQLIDVPRDEFLEPIIKFKNRILKKNQRAFIFYIHGVGNNVCSIANDNRMSMIVGYGAGNPPSYTCARWLKDLLIYKCNQQGWNSYEGKIGGKYSAWSKNNLCQYFRKQHIETSVHCMQLEIIYDLRSSTAKAQLCGECLADFISDIISYNNWDAPKSFKPKQF